MLVALKAPIAASSSPCWLVVVAKRDFFLSHFRVARVNHSRSLALFWTTSLFLDVFFVCFCLLSFISDSFFFLLFSRAGAIGACVGLICAKLLGGVTLSRVAATHRRCARTAGSATPRVLNSGGFIGHEWIPLWQIAAFFLRTASAITSDVLFKVNNATDVYTFFA